MGIINPFEATETKEFGGPLIRLLLCGKCKTIEVLPDYTGPLERAEEYDTALNAAVEQHKDGVERIPHAPAALFKVPEAAWNSPEAQAQIRQQLAEKFDPNAETGLGSDAYALRDNFQADALACFEAHMRNPGCSDYKSDAKQIIPDTASERKEVGMVKFDRHNPRTKRYLCEYCPVHSLVQQAQRKRAGLYG